VAGALLTEISLGVVDRYQRERRHADQRDDLERNGADVGSFHKGGPADRPGGACAIGAPWALGRLGFPRARSAPVKALDGRYGWEARPAQCF